jgi:hypothetical protein
MVRIHVSQPSFVGGVANGYFSLKEKTPFNNVPPLIFRWTFESGKGMM